jgi:hypothetical protein
VSTWHVNQSYCSSCLQVRTPVPWAGRPVDVGSAQEGCEVLSNALISYYLANSFISVASNDFWGKTYMDLAGTTVMTQNLSIATGMSAGATESFVVVPFELVKIKLQDKKSTYAGPIDVVKRVIRADGVLGLYAGLESTFWR